MKAQLLTYNFSAEKLLQIEFICVKMQIYIENVSPWMQNLKLKSIISNSKTAPISNEKQTFFTDEMVVFCNFEENQLDEFLAQLREKNLQIKLKAVLTQTNKNWSSAKLHSELIKEFNFFNK